MEIECDLASIRDEDLLRKMWQQSEDFGRKKEIRSHLYKLRESRLREFYSSGGPGGEIMNPSTDLHYGKTPLTPSHGDSLVDQSFQSLKSKEIRDSLSPTHEVKFRNSGGVAGGVLVPDTTGWDVQTSSEVSPDGRAFRTETLAKTDGVEKLPGGHAEFSGRNEQKSSASHQGDDKNYVKKAAESSKTHLQEKVVIGDENSGLTEMKSSSVTSSSKVTSSSSQQVFTSDDPGFDMEPRRLTQQHDQRYQNMLQAANNSSTLHSERQQFSRNERNERQESTSNLHEENKKYVDMDKASPEYQQHVQYLMSQPGAIVSNTVEYPKPGVKMITTVKKLPDGTTVKTKRYETEATAANTGADSTSISHTTKQQQQQKISSSSTTSQKMTEKRVQDSEDVFTRLARTRDSNVPASPRNAPETPSNEDVYSRLQQSRDHKFSDSLDQRSTQILRDTNQQHPGSRNAPNRRPSDLVENVEMISTTNKTVKKDLNRSEKITSSDFIQNERDRYVLDQDSPSRRIPDGYPEALVPITPSRHGGRPSQPGDDYPTNGYNATEVIKQSSSSKSSAKFSESRRYSTETVESYQHSENENQDYTTRGYPSNRRPIDEPKGQSPRPGGDFSTHGFPSVRSDKPISDRSRPHDDTTERVHIVHTDRGDVNHSDTTTTRSNYSTNETRRHVTKEDFSTHGFPSVRAGTPTRDSPRRPLGSEPSPGDSPRRPSGQEPPAHQVRKPPSDGYSTHGFPSVKSGSPTEDSPRRPSGPEPTNQGRRPTTEDFSTHGFPSVKPAGRSSTPTQSSPQYDSPNRVDRDETASVTSDRSNSVIYEKKIDAAHQAFARSLRCASPVEPVRRDSTDRTPRSSIGSIRNTYSPSKRDTRSPSHDSVTNSESSRISSATVTKSTRPTEVRRVSHPKSPIGKSSPSHVSNETIDLTLTRKITAKPSPDKTTGKPSPGTTPNTSRRVHQQQYNNTTEEEVNTLLDTATKHITNTHSSITPTTTTRSLRPQDTKPKQPETLYSKKPLNKPEGYITLNEANEINEKHNQTTNKHVSYPNYIPSGPKADRSPSTDRPTTTTTNNLSSPAPITTTSTTPHNAPKTTKDKVKPSSSTTTTSPTTKPFTSPSKVDNSTSSRFTKTVKVENAINRDTTTKTKRQPKLEPESDLETSEPLREPEDLDEGYVPDRKGKKKPNSQRPTSDDEGFEPDSPRAGSPTSDFEYRRPEQVETYDEEDSYRKKTSRTDKKVVTNDFLNTERNVTETRRTPVDEPKRPKDREGPKRPGQDDKPSYKGDTPKGPDDQEPKRPQRRPKDEDTEPSSYPKDRKPSQLVDEPGKKPSPSDEPSDTEETNRRPSYQKEPTDKPSRPTETSRPRGTKPPLERSETFEDRCRQILGIDSETVVDRTKKTEEFIETERTTVDSKRRPSGRSPSPTRKQPSDTVSIEDCDDEDLEPERKYPNKTTTTTTTVKTTREQPRDKSPNKKGPGDHPRDESPDGKVPKSATTNKYDETTTTTLTTKITDGRSPSPKRKSPKDREDDTRPIGRSPSERPGRVDETTTIRETTKIVDEIDERSTRTKPGDKSPKETRPREKSPSDTVSIEDCDDDDDDDSPRKYPTNKTTKTTTTVTTTRGQPRDKSPLEKRPNKPRDQSPIDKLPKGTTTNKYDVKTTVVTTTKVTDDRSPSPKRKSPKDTNPEDIRPRGRSPSERPNKVDETTTVRKTSKIVDEIDEQTTRSKPGSKPRDRFPSGTRPKEHWPSDDSETDSRPRDRSPSEKGTYFTTREKTFDVETSSPKSPLRKPGRETSPTDESPRHRSPNKKPVRGTSPTDKSPRDRSPTSKPVRGTSPTDKSPLGESPFRQPVRGTSPTDESPRGRSPTKKPISSPTDKSPRGRSPTDETIISTTTTTHSTTTDGVIEDRYPSYTPRSYPRDRSPVDKQKPKPKTTEEEELVIETSKKTKKTTTEEIHDDVFETKRPREKQPDTRDGAYFSQPRDQSPSEPGTYRPRTDEKPRDRSIEKPTTKETDELITKRTTKTTKDTIIESEFNSPRPKDSPRDRSPSKKPLTEDVTECTPSSRPKTYPRDQSPVNDLTRPTTRETTETRRVDKTTVINDFLDTERGVDRPQRPKEDKPYDGKTPERLTSTQPRDYPFKDSPTQKPKGPEITDIDETKIIKTTKITKDSTVDREVEELFPSNRPRDRSPTEKPIRSPRIVTTETTTEYGITSRPRSQSPSEKPRKPVDSEEIDETYIQKTKITEDTTITTDLDEDIVKPSRRPRPTGTKDQPREKSPQKSKPSDRSPSPRSKYPRDQKPKTEDRSPVGKQPRTTDKSPRRTSPVKPTTYQSTDEETNLVKKTKTTKVTTTSRDVEDVDFEDRPRDRSPIEKPRGFRPINGDQSPRDRLRGPSPAKKPEDREPIDSDYDETVVKRTNKTTRNETTLEEITDLSSKTYPEDKPRDKSPSKPRGQRPTDDRSPKSPRGTSPSEKPRPRDRSPTEKPRRPLLDEETIVQTTSIKTTTLEDQSPKRSRETSPSRDYPRDRSPSGKARKPGMIDEIYVESTTTESTTIKDRLSKSPRGTSPSEKPGPRDYPRDRSPSDKPRNTKLYDDETVVQTTTTTVKDRVTKSPRGSSPSEKPGPRDYPRDRSPSDKPRKTKLYDDETVVETTTTTVKDRLTKGPRGTSPSEKPGSRDYPRDRSPSDKPRKTKLYDDETVVETTTTTVKDRLTKSPRGTSPTEKPRPRDYPRDNSPNDKPRKTRLYDETVVEKTTTESTTVKDRLTKSPRGTSPTEKPRPRESPRDRSPTDKNRPRGLSPTEKPSRRRPVEEKPDETFVRKTTRERKTVKETTDEYVDDCCPEHHPRVKSPLRKPKETKPVGETVVKRTVKTTTVDDHTTKTTPRGSSPTKTSPRERSPTQKPGYERSPKDSPRRTSPSEKPTRRQPIVTEVGKSVQKITSKFSKDIKTSEKVIVKDHPRRKSPSEKPRRLRPTNDEETDDDDETTETIIAVYTIDGETVESHPRDLSPSEKPKSSPRKPSGDYPNGPQTNGHHPRGISPTDKPQRRQPTDEEIEESFTSRTKITKERNTFEEVDRYSEAGQPRESSPTGKPRGRQPTDESIDITFVKKTSRTQKDETSLEETEYQYPEDRPRGRSPSDKPSFRVYPRDSSPTKPTEEDEKSPMRKPQVPQNSEETVLYTTKVTTRIEDHPRDRSPSDKPGPRSYPRDKSPIDKPSVKAYPSDKSPLDKPSRTRPSKLEETTNRSTTVRKTVQETDRYPKGRPGDQSPNEKPSTLRRPSKLSSTTTTTTTRNRSTLDEQDITRTPQRPRTQPSTPGKVPTKSTPLSSPRSQPTSERRIPAELPSPVRKPKSTFGVTTKTTTTTTTRSTGASPRPRLTTETPKKPSKLPLETRPTARPVERKLSPSISPDSSPSRPGSDFEVDSPYRSPNMSPSRKSPSPTRSVKLEDITTTTTTKKTTLLTDKSSKPKVTHVTTAKFQITPPTSPNKVINSPEIKFSPSPKKPSSRVPTPKPNKFTSETTTTKKVTSKIYKDGLIPTDSERDSEVPTDAEEVDTPLQQKPSTRKLPVTERKESAPVHRVTKINKDIQMSRSTSENIIKTPITKRPVRHEPLEPQREVPSSRPTVNDRSSPKTERRPSKHLSTKTINLTAFDKVINSEDMENVVIDIQHAKSSREPSPNKIVPTPVSVDMYTGKPRYPDVVQEPEDEPKKKPTVKNIPIFEEETNDFVGCQITEVNEETHENTVRARTTKFIEKESSPQRQTPRIVTGDNVDSECLLSVHDKVSKFISTAEEVSKPKTSAPFRRDVPEKDMPEDDECLLTVDEKVSKFLKTADSVTKEVITSKPRRVERPSIEDLDEDLKTDECVLSVSEKVNKFTTKAEKLAPSAPQRSPELVARIERQISRQSDVESEGPESEDSPASVRKFKPSSPLTERTERKYTERQIDILSRPSVWEKKPKPDVKLDDIFGYKPEDVPRDETHPDEEKSKPVKTTGSVSKRKELFENKVSTNKTTTTTKQSSPEKRPSRPSKSPSERRPSDDSDSRYPNEFVPRYVDGYPNQHPDDDVHEDVYGSSKTRRVYETSSRETTTIHRSPERSPTRKSSHPEIRPLPTTNKSPRQQQQPEDKTTPSRRYSEDHSPRYPTRDQPSADRYMETREASEHTTRRRSSTQEYPERRTPYTNGSPSPSSLRKQQQQPVEEPEDYTFSSKRDETTTHHHNTTRTAPRSPKDSPLTPNSFLDDEDHDHSPARSTSTVSSHKQVTTSRTSMTKRLTEDTSRRPRRPSGNEPTTPTSTGRTPRSRAVPETVAARRNIFEKTPGDISPMPSGRRPSYMEPTKSSLEHRKDSLEITKTNFSRKSSMEEEPYEPSPRTSVKFGVGLKHKEEPKPKRKLSSSDIPNIEDVFELELLEEMLNIVTLYEQRRRIRAQIRVVKKLLETKTKEEVSRMTKISTIRKTSSSSVRESPTPKRESRPERYQPTDDDIDSESIIESRHVEEHEEIIRERSISPQTKTSRIVTKVTEVRKIAEPSSTPNKRTPLKTKDEPKESKPIWATKNILKKPSENEKVTRALSAKKTTSTSSSSMSRTQQQTHRQRVSTDDDCVTSSYGIGPTDEDGRPLFGIRALKKKTTTNNNTVQPSETTKVTGTVITEKYYSENGAEPVGERKVTVYSTNPEDLVDLETQYDRRDSETVKREKLSKDGVTTVTKVQKIGKYKPGEIPSLTDDAEFSKSSSKIVRRGSVKEMSEKFIRKESSSSVTEKSSSGYPKAGLILRTRTNSGATADTADQYEVRGKSTEYDYESEDDVEIRTSRKHSKVVTESEDETEIRRKVNTRSFLNSGGSKVTGVDDVLDRMRNADNVVVDGDTMEDREARSLLNKFLGASVLMSGMESMIPQMELRKSTAGADNKQEVKTTRVTKTIKTGTTGGSSSSPVARETCDFEEIWDEETLKQLLEKSTSYEERRSIRARLRQLMADREACAESKASAKAELNETKVKTSTKVTAAAVEDDESSGSEYEEIIEEYTASEDDDQDEETTTTKTTTTKTVIPDKKKIEVKEDKNTKQITEEIKKTTITKKEEPKSGSESKKTVIVETTTVIEEVDDDDDDEDEDDTSSPSNVDEKKVANANKKEDVKDNKDGGDSDSVSDSKGQSTTTTEKTETKKEDGGVVTTTTKVTTRTITGAPKPVSPFAKFQQLDKQNSLQSPKSPLTPTTPGGSSTTPIFKFTDPALNARAATFKEQLLQWCQSKTQEYENVQITNFSASWTDGLAFCALIHHFLPDAFDYSTLNPKQRRYNFELAFRVADEKAGIAPLLDVEDMVVMKRPDWKCVFTYVQSIYRRFRNCQ
ncbi:titin isoform X3 [Episyrphus balteatus]|uniref:titin isoform X3 n=1 Tax=Episyrphus balteatus TaxID=286459 RepID=UPI0024868ED0|nr:titin isoform X3 [Episyrphus balteatus]